MRKTIKPRPNQFSRVNVTVEQTADEPPYAVIHGIGHVGELDDTAYKALFHVNLERAAVETLVEQLQRALKLL